jgi:recombinational DNA repair protein RecR
MPTTKSKTVTKVGKQFCRICGKGSDVSICGACSDKVRAEAVNHKRSEDKGKA